VFPPSRRCPRRRPTPSPAGPDTDRRPEGPARGPTGRRAGIPARNRTPGRPPPARNAHLNRTGARTGPTPERPPDGQEHLALPCADPHGHRSAGPTARSAPPPPRAPSAPSPDRWPIVGRMIDQRRQAPPVSPAHLAPPPSPHSPAPPNASFGSMAYPPGGRLVVRFRCGHSGEVAGHPRNVVNLETTCPVCWTPFHRRRRGEGERTVSTLYHGDRSVSDRRVPDAPRLTISSCTGTWPPCPRDLARAAEPRRRTPHWLVRKIDY
jgi:hypothetical protein